MGVCCGARAGSGEHVAVGAAEESAEGFAGEDKGGGVCRGGDGDVDADVSKREVDVAGAGIEVEADRGGDDAVVVAVGVAGYNIPCGANGQRESSGSAWTQASVAWRASRKTCGGCGLRNSRGERVVREACGEAHPGH
ncbi:hypothetical protein GUJ93_ZPchr0011g27265 [Zizania palustris]|uniref:Uncharacterized protein n=1 Tax=Zizania palustris TaxID=103762 RepID=A0A8J5WKH3_ZIZPA|nr:hypothetical protein GUJ93_ZPchr0011g27265 [Zizania palustris]